MLAGEEKGFIAYPRVGGHPQGLSRRAACQKEAAGTESGQKASAWERTHGMGHRAFASMHYSRVDDDGGTGECQPSKPAPCLKMNGYLAWCAEPACIKRETYTKAGKIRSWLRGKRSPYGA